MLVLVTLPCNQPTNQANWVNHTVTKHKYFRPNNGFYTRRDWSGDKPGPGDISQGKNIQRSDKVYLQASLPSQGTPVIPVYEDDTDEEPDVEDIDVDSKVATNMEYNIWLKESFDQHLF